MNFLEFLKIILIGIVEGITEWLPISSTGHMLLIDEFITLNMSAAFKEMFFVVIQLGAIFAVIILFWQKLFPFQNKKHLKKTSPDDHLQLKFFPSLIIKKDILIMWLKVAVACIPTAILGFLLDDFLEQHFGSAISIAIVLIIYGIAFIIIETWNKKRTPTITTLNQINYQTALLFGLFQSLAMIPGTSRSGATIIGALLIGVSRTIAAEFSFFLAIPTMFGASLFKLIKFGFAFSTIEFIALITGMLVAFFVSLFALRFLMNYIKKHDFKIFGWYRILLGILILLIVSF